jgi:hypothetical protein
LKPASRKEYKNILLGYSIIAFTDHKNNTFNGLKASDRVLRLYLLLEEYGVTFEYLPGKTKKNNSVVANALFRLEIDSLKIQEEEEYLPGKKNVGDVTDALSRLDIDSLKIQ